jgi:hypothetical protein
MTTHIAPKQVTKLCAKLSSKLSPGNASQYYALLARLGVAKPTEETTELNLDATCPAPIMTRAEALAMYDGLEPVDVSFMIGRWHGEGLPTGHPMDGLLEAYNWYGKEFVDADTVHPLLFTDSNGEIYKVNPGLMPMQLAGRVPGNKSWPARKAFQLMQPMISTSTSKATLRLTEYRGKRSATMIYDQLPIHDSFRKLDDNTVIGVMDCKGMDQPFFFKLFRDAA